MAGRLIMSDGAGIVWGHAVLRCAALVFASLRANHYDCCGERKQNSARRMAGVDRGFHARIYNLDCELPIHVLIALLPRGSIGCIEQKLAK
jgi:hypothetical protein